MTHEEQARIRDLEAEVAAVERLADRRRARAKEAEERGDRLFALVQDHEEDAAAHRQQLAAWDRSDSHGVDPLGTLIERALAERDTLAAEVRAWRLTLGPPQLANETALLEAIAATNAAGALVRERGAT